MSGRHRNDLPDEHGEGGHEASAPPPYGGSGADTSDWFTPRDTQGRPIAGRSSDYGEDPLTSPPGGSPGYPAGGPSSGRYQSRPSGGYERPGGSGGYQQPGGGYERPAGSGGYERPAGGGGHEQPGRYDRPAAGGGHGQSGGYERPGTGGYGTPGRHDVPGAAGAAGAAGRGGSGESDIPDWFGTEGGGRRSGFEAGGFGGASDPGYGPGRPGGPGAGREPGERGEGGSFAGAGYGAYESISRSDGGPTLGGRSGGGSRRSGDYDSGDYEYGRRRKRRGAGMIGPMAGAVGLALLLGVGVYAFAGGGGCGDDALSLDVAVAPDIEPAVAKTVGRFNDAEHEVDGKCVKATVRAAEPSAVSTLLQGQSVESAGNRRPDVWIPDSSLWVSLVRTSEKGKDAVQPTKTSVAQSPIVVAMPQQLTQSLRQNGTMTNPSWDSLLSVAGGSQAGTVTKNQLLPARSVRLYLPDPSRNAAGMGSLLIANTLLANDPDRESVLTGIVRKMRENTTPTVKSQFASFRRDRQGRYPIALSSEQAVWAHNRDKPQEPAVAIYPTEGTLLLDYPLAVSTADPARRQAARLLEQAVNTEPAREDVRGQGFRSADGKAPTTFDDDSGVDPRRVRQLPAPQPAVVQGLMQAWAKLSLGMRMLSVIDISGSMLESSGGVTRMQATARVAQGGLSLMSNDSELGQWVFSTEVDGSKDYKETVPIGPLGERIGSTTRRQLILSSLSQMRPKPNGDTGLYDTILAAYEHMTGTYKPEFVNSIVLFTDGKNDDDNGPTLNQTLDRLRGMADSTKPVQVIIIGIGSGIDVNELRQIAAVTGGSVYVARTPAEIQKIFLQAMSRRISN
ncbi:substrate-binding and VWA domain-containing protein [Thermomonospora amylolytica]|uniref:substrate-binding and VWA domain-containing protein n=1 Tax=Thermomonospora amylolytica TaxID=1411117 RepID=UPI000E6C8B0E|nr:substrate-binding and VWA domain-containing protein [Thermomonospora amylolytica]